MSDGSPPLDPLHALCRADAVWAERYEGWTELGHGASATVVKTFSRAAGEELALKLYQRLDEDDRERFRQEVRHCQRLTSPFIVRTYSPFLRAALSWIEMEWVDGPDLKQELERRRRAGQPFALEQARALGAAVAQALHVAHAAGVIHRDVKPANVLLPRDGQPVAKLGDFGISRVAGAARVTATGILAGTPQFVAPEVVAGQRADQRSDVYSLGLVLYLLFSNGCFPFEVSDPEAPGQWLRAHAEARPRPLTELRSDLDRALAGLLLQALAKDPRQRPSAGELMMALDPRAGRLPIASTRRREGPQRLWLAAAGGALAGLTLGAWMIPGRGPVEGPRARSAPATRPAARPSAAVEAPVAMRLEGDLLTLASRGTTPFEALVVTLESREGVRIQARPPGALRPGDELTLTLESFTPAPPAGFRPATLELSFEAAGQRQQARLPFS